MIYISAHTGKYVFHTELECNQLSEDYKELEEPPNDTHNWTECDYCQDMKLDFLTLD